MKERERRQRAEIFERQEQDRRAVHYRRGTIVALDPLEITLGGSETTYEDVRALDSAGGAVGDEVAVLVWHGDLLVLGTISATGWIEVSSLTDGNFSISSGDVGYRLVAGIVFLRGYITMTGSPSDGDILFTLPEGYRPDQRMRFHVLQGTENQVRIDVSQTGEVQFKNANGSSDFSLDQISFVADQ
jgi:hypothetical protein